MFTSDFLMRITALLLLFVWRFYWFIAEVKADKEKQKTKKQTPFKDQMLHALGLFLAGVLGLQLLGLPILLIAGAPFSVQAFGLGLLICGASISILAREALGTNWANSYEYQIKAKQKLVTFGIYKYIRHPIYVGLFFMYVGGQLVAKSYLFLSVVLLLLWAYFQAKREEVILLKHFGTTYRNYLRKTKMFIPFIF